MSATFLVHVCLSSLQQKCDDGQVCGHVSWCFFHISSLSPILLLIFGLSSSFSVAHFSPLMLSYFQLSVCLEHQFTA